MLTRAGSEPGPEWMRKLSDNPQKLRKVVLRTVIFFGIIQACAVAGGDIAVYAVYRAHGQHISSYDSPVKVAGMPLLSIGGKAHGVIAYGGVATGIVAIGGVTAGLITFGGLGMGFFSFGGLSLAWIAVGGVAIGWRAMGGLAIGDAALGGLAIGRCAYAGNGIALGRDEAGGNQKESLFG